jgi:hypothetical protein
VLPKYVSTFFLQFNFLMLPACSEHVQQLWVSSSSALVCASDIGAESTNVLALPDLSANMKE